jgi:hypothetical protein
MLINLAVLVKLFRSLEKSLFMLELDAAETQLMKDCHSRK